MAKGSQAIQRILHTAAGSELRGQAVSLYMLAIRGSGALGCLAPGLSVSWFGVREALLINGLLAILVQILLGRHRRDVITNTFLSLIDQWLNLQPRRCCA